MWAVAYIRVPDNKKRVADGTRCQNLIIVELLLAENEEVATGAKKMELSRGTVEGTPF